MGADTRIEWAHDTWNPVIGCQAVSAACDHCYAERLAKRFGIQFGPHGERRRTSIANWQEPLRWDRQAAKAGNPRRVFTASLADFFDNAWPIDVFVDALDVVRVTTHLRWLILTKRPQLIRRRLQEAFETLARGVDRGDLIAWIGAWLHGTPPAHVWLGTTVENQAEADRRIPHLLAVPAARRFLSMEPLLGPVDLTLDGLSCGPCPRCSEGQYWEPDTNANPCPHCDGTGKGDEVLLDWVIAGGESGPKARPSHPDWFRNLRDQCQAAGVPFFFKQWGEWIDHETALDTLGEDDPRVGDGRTRVRDGQDGLTILDNTTMIRVGKKAAGAMLDGREWREVPA